MVNPPSVTPCRAFPTRFPRPFATGPGSTVQGWGRTAGPARVASDALGNGQGRSFSAVVRLPRSARYVTWLAESESAGCQLASGQPRLASFCAMQTGHGVRGAQFR